MEKIGFTYERDFVDDGVRSVLYRLAAPPSVV
jgi:hypothetical protein